MKLVLSMLLMAALFTTSCKTSVKGPNGVEYTTAVQYNDYILAQQKNIYDRIFMVSNKFQSGNFAEALPLIKGSAPTIDSAIAAVKGMPDWKGNKNFRDAATDLFEFYKRMFANDFSRIAEIGIKGENATDQDRADLQSIPTKVSAEETGLDQKMQAAQKEFATQNNFKIERKALQDKVDNMNK